MGYRVVWAVAPGCDTVEGEYEGFDAAYEGLAHAMARHRGHRAWLERETERGWVEVFSHEIDRLRVRPVEFRRIEIGTPTDEYVFELPEPVQVPNNMSSRDVALFAVLRLLGLEPTVRRRED